MKQTNKQLFEDYSTDSYFKSNEEAEKDFKSIKKFPEALGFDEASDGFIVLHRFHAESGILDEIPACLVLKNLGFGVELMLETAHEKSADVRIDGTIFEMKRIVFAENIDNAVRMHFRRSYKKANNLVLEIAKKTPDSVLKKALRSAANYYRSIESVWLIYEGNLYRLSNETLRSEAYSLKKNE